MLIEDIEHKLTMILSAYVKDFDGGPHFRKNLSSEELDDLFSNLYKLLLSIVERREYESS